MIDRSILKILACPFHTQAALNFDEAVKSFSCSACGRSYRMIEKDGVCFLDFMVAKHDSEMRVVRSEHALFKKIQGRPFKRTLEEGRIVLDIGCGENPRGNVNLDCYIPDRIPGNFILADAEFLPLRNGSIDIVLSNYSVEHMLNPAAFIRRICDISRERVEIVTDNSEWFGDILFRLIGSGRIFNEEHCYKWSVEYLQNLLGRMGIKNSKVYLLNLSTNPLVKLISFLGRLPRIGNFFYRDLKVVILKNDELSV